MNTKHFLTAAVLVAGLFFAGFEAEAQRGRDNRDNRDRRDNRDYRGNRDNRGNDRYHRHQPRHRPIYAPRVFVPPVAVCLPAPRPRRYVRRTMPCSPGVCYAPPRRAHHHRWHR